MTLKFVTWCYQDRVFSTMFQFRAILPDPM